MVKPLPPVERLVAKSLAVGDCLLWQGQLNNRGYGRLSVNGRLRLAHRFAYEIAYGEIPAGHDIDHLCCQRNCVNPDHLEAVTHRENLRRGKGFAGDNARKTHCAQGHLLEGDNVYLHPTNGRYCRTCKRRWDAERRERKRAER